MKFQPGDRVRIKFNVDLYGCFGINTFLSKNQTYIVERYNAVFLDKIYLKNDHQSYNEKYFYRVGTEIESIMENMGYTK